MIPGKGCKCEGRKAQAGHPRASISFRPAWRQPPGAADRSPCSCGYGDMPARHDSSFPAPRVRPCTGPRGEAGYQASASARPCTVVTPGSGWPSVSPWEGRLANGGEPAACCGTGWPTQRLSSIPSLVGSFQAACAAVQERLGSAFPHMGCTYGYCGTQCLPSPDSWHSSRQRVCSACMAR